MFYHAGTGITQAEYGTVTALVSSALSADRDPLDLITWDGTTFKMKSGPLGPPPYVSDAAPVPLVVGGTVTVTGGNFQSVLASNSVTIAGVPVTLSTGSPTQLRGTVPAGARSGFLQVATVTGAATFDVTVLQNVGGEINKAGSLPASAAGANVSGGVFSRLWESSWPDSKDPQGIR
ncbi:MAG: IPT/TIG domain-containing protein [Candidatus Sericytochromatia bacterium]|nr:IPT/TIG domain-containing protein [Candidatus Tanganyikabacteria bacterium]